MVTSFKQSYVSHLFLYSSSEFGTYISRTKREIGLGRWLTIYTYIKERVYFFLLHDCLGNEKRFVFEQNVLECCVYELFRSMNNFTAVRSLRML